MKRRKFLLGSSAALASAGFLTGTGAFSSAEVKRDVKIVVVSDSEGYLGLSEDGAEMTEYLFGDEGYREAPETFQITNQTTTTVEVDLSLKENNLVFNEPQDSDFPKILDPGEPIDVEVSLPDGTGREDTLVFDVTGEDGKAVEIHAERMLKLEPQPVGATISGGGSIDAEFVVQEPDAAVIENFVANRTKFDPTKSESHKAKIDYDDKSDLGCNSNNKITVTVEGSAPGKVFSEDVTVNCPRTSGNNENSENDGDSENNGDGGENDDS